MIVKITYSVDLEEIPTEVSKLLRSVQEESTKFFELLDITAEELSEKKDINISLLKIEKSLDVFEKLEAKLKDSHAILTGYLGVLEVSQKEESNSEHKTHESGTTQD